MGTTGTAAMTAGSAEVLLVGGSVVPAADAGPAVTADVALMDGDIAAVGPAATALRGRRTEVVELRGAVIFPGLVDGHTHPVMGLDVLAGADLSGCTTLDQVHAALLAFSRLHPGDSWLVASGLNPNVVGTAPLSSAVLAPFLQQRRAILHLFDGHAAVATVAALAAAGLSGGSATSGDGGVPGIVVDVTGSPTGLLLEEEAIRRVSDLTPLAPPAVRRAGLRQLLLDMAATGLTGAHVMDAKGDALELFSALDGSGELPMRLRVAPWCRPDDPVEPLLALQAAGGRLWQVAGVKMFLDGTIDGGTAWLSGADCYGESVSPGWEPAEFARRVALFHDRGIPVAVHAIGDAAVRCALDTFTALPARSGVRHRIEHLECLPADLVPRFATSGVTASMQPRHATDYTRADGTDNWSRRLGPDRAATGWRLADVARSGGRLVIGSDWPVAPYDGRATVAAAVLRRSPVDPGAAPVQPAQALTVAEALQACTTAPWSAASGRGGRVTEGLPADLTVFAEDPRRVAAADLPQLPVLLTVAGGRVAFRSP